MSWLARLFSPRPAPRDRAAAAAPVPPVAAAGPAPVALPATPPLLAWLLTAEPASAGPMGAAEQRALRRLDEALAAPSLPADLLPRTAALIPQLLAMLRQTALPVPTLAQRVARDVVLAAEVLRLASSPYYRAQGGVTDLGQAIALIGENGLRTVIARVVLKPMYEATPGTLSTRAAERLAQHAEALAGALAACAPTAGLPPFDGYIAGLLHDSGWSVALRLIDRAGIELPLPPSAEFAAAAAERAHRLFGLAARGWNITPGFDAFAADAGQRRVAASTDPLGRLLPAATDAASATLAAAG